MAITFKSVGHAFATFFKNASADIAKLQKTETTVETVTQLVPGGAPIVGIESVAYACLGELAGLISAGDSAAESKLADAGLDSAVVASVKALVGSASQIGTLVKGK